MVFLVPHIMLVMPLSVTDIPIVLLMLVGT